jgi:WD40 repeat protein
LRPRFFIAWTLTTLFRRRARSPTQASPPLLGHAPASTVTALAALPRGALASAGSDGAVCIWARPATAIFTADAPADATAPPPGFACTQELHGHTSEVRALALLRCGALLSGAWDAELRLWRAPDDASDDASPSAPPRRFACAGVWRGHSGPVWALCALPDGGAASGAEDTTVRIWPPPRASSSSASAQTPHTPRLMLRGHTEDVDALCVLACGLRLASGSIDATVRLWRLSDGACEALLAGHGDCVTALAPLRDASGNGGIGGIGFGVASASADRSVRVWRAPLAGVPPPPELQPPSLLPGDVPPPPPPPPGASASAAQQSGGSGAQLGLPRPEDLLCLLGPFRMLLPRPRGGAPPPPGAAARGKAAATLQAHAQPVAALISLNDGRLVSGGADAALCVWGRAPAANPLLCAIDPVAAAWRCERVLQTADGPAAARPVTAIVAMQDGAADAPSQQQQPSQPSSPVTPGTPRTPGGSGGVCGASGSPRAGPPVRIAVAFGGRVRVWQLRGGAVEETFSATRPTE